MYYMNLKEKEFLIIVGVIPLVLFGIIVGWTDLLKENDIVLNNSDEISVYGPLDLDGNPTYVPSDMTKANSNFKIGHGDALWLTTNVRDIKDRVAYTIQGTVLSIGDPIDWNSSEYDTQGYIPVTISVEKIYKGDWTEDTFTFYFDAGKFGSHYVFIPNSLQFEIDEKILIHLSFYVNDLFPDGYYDSPMREYTKFQLQTYPGNIVDGVASTDDVILAFNIHHKYGIPLDSISGAALE